jgi:hypothetical protein
MLGFQAPRVYGAGGLLQTILGRNRDGCPQPVVGKGATSDPGETPLASLQGSTKTAMAPHQGNPEFQPVLVGIGLSLQLALKRTS